MDFNRILSNFGLYMCHAFSMHQVLSIQKYSEMAISITVLKHCLEKY